MKQIFCLILLMTGFLTYGQTSIETNTYKFPVKQGTKEWTQFESTERRIAALQMPDSVVMTFNTGKLPKGSYIMKILKGNTVVQSTNIIIK
ncbi:MAG: hypothetical protein LBJ17_03900 [Dysgonamonadaceae bacterium]|jgi:hypothetical protein|nr:hypothetical protein [Dysgonamonadaceae bacterium]